MKRAALIAIAFLVLVGSSATAQKSDFKEIWSKNFESNTDDWIAYESDLSITDSGATGIAPFAGNSYMAIGPNFGNWPGAFSRFDGYRDSWPGTWRAEIAVYLDINWAADTGFDYSVAANGSDGNHQRDYIFHVWKLDDGNLYVAASNNSDFSVNQGKMNGISNKYAVPSSGWYILRHTFYELLGFLVVDCSLVDSNGNVVFTETRGPGGDDDIPGSVGGNRYAWFTFVDVAEPVVVATSEVSPAASEAVSLYVDDHYLYVDTEYFELNFETNGPGSLTGDTYQEVFTGEDATGVTVNVPVTHTFTGWYDESDSLVTTDETLTVTGVSEDQTYTAMLNRNRGSLRVNIDPATGSGWRIAGQVGWRNSGTTATGIPTATINVEFLAPEGFATPDPVQVIINSNQLTTVNITMEGVEAEADLTHSVQIIITDLDINVDDANLEWRFVDGPGITKVSAANSKWYKSSDRVTGLTPGVYTVEFRHVAGFLKPGLKTFELEAGSTFEAVVDYPRPFISAAQDYDGDGAIDVPVRAPNMKRAWVANGLSDADDLILNKKIGGNNDTFVPGDFDGDGTAEIGFYRHKIGLFRVPGVFAIKEFGNENAIPVPGDYNGDGLTDAALYDAEEGTWTIYFWPNDETVVLNIGSDKEVPVPADYNGDGLTDPAVWNVNNAKWNIYTWRQAKQDWKKYGVASFIFGSDGDIPVPADYNGDGMADHVVFRPGTGEWIANDEDVLKTVTLGETGDFPVPADWTGEGYAIPAVFRSSTGEWLTVDDVFEFVFGEDGWPLVSGIFF